MNLISCFFLTLTASSFATVQLTPRPSYLKESFVAMDDSGENIQCKITGLLKESDTAIILAAEISRGKLIIIKLAKTSTQQNPDGSFLIVNGDTYLKNEEFAYSILDDYNEDAGEKDKILLPKRYFYDKVDVFLDGDVGLHWVLGMEYLGEDLETYMENVVSKLKPEEQSVFALEFEIEVMKILKFLQKAKIIHNDIKPANFVFHERRSTNIQKICIIDLAFASFPGSELPKRQHGSPLYNSIRVHEYLPDFKPCTKDDAESGLYAGIQMARAGIEKWNVGNDVQKLYDFKTNNVAFPKYLQDIFEESKFPGVAQTFAAAIADARDNTPAYKNIFHYDAFIPVFEDHLKEYRQNG